MKLSELSPWSAPKADLAHQAQIWHARSYAAWLLSAGAEPRFGALLSSGETAEERWAQLLQEQGVLVERCQVTAARPLPVALTQHRGDHFNRKLFLLEGLDQLEGETLTEVIKTLNGQRNPLKQSATWVTLLFRSATSLSAFLEHAPHAWALLERRCLMWESDERPPPERRSEPKGLPRWAHPLEELYWALEQPARPISAQTFDRFVRAGVQRPPRGAHERWRALEAIWRGDVDFKARRRSSGAGVVEPLEGVSAEEAFCALLHRSPALSAGVKVQLEGLLSPTQAWLLSESPPEALEAQGQRSSWVNLKAAITAEAPLSEAALEALAAERARDAESLMSQPHLLGLTGLWLAEAAAQAGSLELCLSSLEGVERDPRCSLEARFLAGERLVALYTALQRRPEAQALIKALFARAFELGAPLYEARATYAKAGHLGALDPSRGERESLKASRLALLHGLELS